MKEERFFYVPRAEVLHELPAEEANHATRILRMQGGDEMVVMDGEGTFYRAELTLATPKKCLYEVKETMKQERTWRGRIHLAIAPTKNIDRMEWLVEKATEVGFDEISFLNCKFSERRNIRADRIEKIVVAAMKQSRKAWKPIVNELIDFDKFVGQPLRGKKFIAHCYDEVERKDLYELLGQTPADEEVTVLVGPEGDFSIDEVNLALDKGFESVSLGNSRLRTETAGLMAVTMAQLLKRV